MNECEKEVQEKLEVWQEAEEATKQFAATEVLHGQPIVPKDIFEMAVAFAREELTLLEWESAAERCNKWDGWEKRVETLQPRIEALKYDLSFFENRKFPPRVRAAA